MVCRMRLSSVYFAKEISDVSLNVLHVLHDNIEYRIPHCLLEKYSISIATQHKFSK